MLTQRTLILDALTEAGWRVLSVETADLDWWADEVIVLESLWSPKGILVTLTFLVDPAHDGPRRKGQAVRAVSAGVDRFHGPTRPIPEKETPHLAIGGQWRGRLSDFVDSVNALRAGSSSSR